MLLLLLLLLLLLVVVVAAAAASFVLLPLPRPVSPVRELAALLVEVLAAAPVGAVDALVLGWCSGHPQ